MKKFIIMLFMCATVILLITRLILPEDEAFFCFYLITWGVAAGIAGNLGFSQMGAAIYGAISSIVIAIIQSCFGSDVQDIGIKVCLIHLFGMFLFNNAVVLWRRP